MLTDRAFACLLIAALLLAGAAREIVSSIRRTPEAAATTTRQGLAGCDGIAGNPARCRLALHVPPGAA